MGCFLGCFRYSNKRKKRRKSSIRIIYEEQGHGSYESLQPEVDIRLQETEEAITYDSKSIKDKPKGSLSSKIKKKVSFNLNVKMYESIPNDETADSFPLWNEVETPEKSEVMENSAISLFNHDSVGNSVGSRMVLYPDNYRYKNIACDICDEDETILDESDDDYDIGDTDDEDSCESRDEEEYDGTKINEFEFIEQFYSQAEGSMEEHVMNAHLPAEIKNNRMPHDSFSVRDLKKCEENCSARDRSRYIYSVLNPVANLSQWKAMKARSVPSLMHQKENIPSQEQQNCLNSKTNFNQSSPGSRSNLDTSKPIVHVVNCSLANWLASPKNNKR